VISPSHQPDHDAALRASLSTLLSCAAAARSFPNSKPEASAARAQHGSARIDPNSLRMVPEAVLHGRHHTIERRVSSDTSTSMSSNDHSDNVATDKASKRKAAGVRSNSKDRQSHAAKKVRRASVDEVVSPTLLTWVVSAGVIVVVSALSFSAGYTIGHESGKLEAESFGAGVAASKSVSRSGVSLRRLRWSSAAASVAAVGA